MFRLSHKPDIFNNGGIVRATLKRLGAFLVRHDLAVRNLCRIGFAGSLLAIIVLTLLPADDLPDLRLSDKIAHTTAYAEATILGLLGYRNPRAAVVVIATVTVLGGALEIVQLLIPSRSGDVLDFVANCLGVAAGLLLVRPLLTLWSWGRMPGPKSNDSPLP